jgi:serine/threonine protein kinase
MDAPGIVPSAINCHSCSAVIDLTGQTAFTHVECPQCNAVSVVPVQFGNFLLLNLLGIGGMGTVYKAIDLSLNRYLALKILRKKLAANPEFTENFSHEARAAASVNHPNLAQVYSFGEQDGQYYLAMELLERGSLDDRMARLGKLAEKDVLDIGVQIASGLRAAAQRGLLHRDIKPGNILFSEQGTPKIVDFGLARAQAAPQGTGQAVSEPIWGTPYYIAPEKLRGQPEDFRSDIYSLGATLFHALAGRPPFEAATADEVVTKHAVQPAYSLKTYVPTVQDYTAHVIGRMLAKNPAERYESYDALLYDLQEAQQVLKTAESAPAIVTETGERISLSSILSTLAALIVCGVVIWFVWQNRVKWFALEPPPPAPNAAPSTPATPSAETPGAETGAATGETGGETVDFNEEAPWVKAWNVATLQLTQGRYTEALLGFDTAKTLLRGHPVHRQWVYFFEGITLLAADRPSESVASFVNAMDPLVKPRVPATITTANFVNPLAQTMMNALPLADLEKAVPQMPPWAAALTHLTAGFKHIEKGQFDRAAAAFRDYKEMTPDDAQQWAFNLQPLADRLAHECDYAAHTLATVSQLKQAGKLGEAMQTLQDAAAKTKIASFKTMLEQDEAQLQQALDVNRQQQDEQKQQQAAAQQAQAAQDQQKAGQETKILQAADAAANPSWAVYDFATAETKYEAVAPQIVSAAGRQGLDQRLAAAKLLVEFKTQLAADIARRSYDNADLQTRSGVKLAGRLTRATDSELTFTTPYGELASSWGDFAPETLQALAEYYAGTSAQTDPPENVGRRYLTLAVFSRQYGLDRAAASYAQQAARLAPDLQTQIDLIFGKPSS